MIDDVSFLQLQRELKNKEKLSFIVIAKNLFCNKIIFIRKVIYHEFLLGKLFITNFIILYKNILYNSE